ncbi:MAG: ribonuclease III [Megasphaera sp.]|jgi:ribonuclease-3|nr:ribonuclease III [Megasphaera sp.]MCH4187032.1 ribonuclease III [Megasphaera sp.]MCH4217032.1 ribonuclease III [Megasphaera sp.]
MDRLRKEQLEKFISILGLEQFHQLSILDKALTHSSYANENKGKHGFYNERLEFLGDAILDLVVGEYLFLQYPHMPEGELSKARASVVSETPLAAVCASFHMGEYILLGKGELASGGRTRASIMADAFEAVVGAIYIDSTYEEARKFILHQLKGYLELVAKGDYGKDYKTLFQEFIQRDGEHIIAYQLCRQEGPDHDKTFYMEVIVNGSVLGEGAGKTKKDAEQHAAHEALMHLHAI